jgi:hypothetical protein
MHRAGPADKDADGERDLWAFLSGVRRRSQIAGLLAGCAVAAVLNETCRWGSVSVNIWANRRVLPVLDVGPFFLAALPFVLRARWRLPAIALRTDARLGLCDRLASFLDFRERDDVPARLREAQAAESARAIAGIPIGAAAPLRPWLAAGPALLALSLLYPLFLPNGPETSIVLLVRQIAPGTTTLNDAPGVRQGPGTPDSPPRPPGAKEGSGPERAAGGGTDRDTRPSAPRTPPLQEDAKSGLADGDAARQAREERKPPAPDPRQGGPVQEPEHIESERVGTSLAKVVEPLFNPGAAAPAPAPAPSGSFAYHLLPKTVRGGPGGASRAGDAQIPERVTVDFDALPEQYRSLVRTYFELLARKAAPPADDNPIRSERTR